MSGGSELDTELHESLIAEPNMELRESLIAEPNTDLRESLIAESNTDLREKLIAEPNTDLREKLIAESNTDLREKLIAEPNTDLREKLVTGELTSNPNEKKPSDLRRKLNALALIVGHDVLLVGAISYFAGGISWLWESSNILEAGVIGIQLVIAAWLMLPTTSWRIRPVALYLAIGVIYVGILFVLVYIFAYPLVHTLHVFPVQFHGDRY